ncbi:hypothetical protein F4553_001831 [Allocatelliglobosispora scoriae]|uniref:DUF1232 domain-containing protein n=1 Tax=Allocatelliglobosispora scoriae TaxID=643052 RepID=A0A841BNY9_9ACTN|nr:YkvA family protein [Allocatelliglobosispora scoriae]MBB5868452.1 hypothetical protein [Allocatelliglobosispora scoriae]
MSREAWIAVAIVVAIIAAVTIFGAVKLARRLWKTKKTLNELGAGGNWVFWGAMAYTIFPIDILPDPIYLDDMGVLGAALIYLTRLVQKKRAAGAFPHARTETRQVEQRRR